MSQTPIYEEVVREVGQVGRDRSRRPIGGADSDEATPRSARPVMLRAGGGRHRRPGE